jgi:rhodanese-related sulfurtransferase
MYLMKKLTIAFVLISTLACAQKNNSDNKKTELQEQDTAQTPCNFCNVNPQEFSTRVKAIPGQVLDVRTAQEVANGKIANAINYDINDSNFEQQMQKLDKTKLVYVYCAAGGRSKKAMNWMKANGFTQVVNLAGGFDAWTKNNLPVEK